MKIEKLMCKDLIICQTTDTISDIASLMQRCDIGFIPIAEDKKIVGVITDRDIVINAISNNADLDSEIEKYITRNVISINKDKTVEDAVNLMGVEKIKRLLVTDKDKLVGVLSLSDIINSDIDNQLIIDNQKKIWEIFRNIDEYKTEIDDFYL
jgi:predicted transcriptional regulator